MLTRVGGPSPDVQMAYVVLSYQVLLEPATTASHAAFVVHHAVACVFLTPEM
jgi:hypothetical protein